MDLLIEDNNQNLSRMKNVYYESRKENVSNFILDILLEYMLKFVCESQEKLIVYVDI